MDDVKNRLARDLSAAIAAAVAQSADVDACHERARAAGFHLKVTLEATVGFAQADGSDDAEAGEADVTATDGQGFEVSASDRRFLRSLRIAADEAQVEN